MPGGTGVHSFHPVYVRCSLLHERHTQHEAPEMSPQEGAPCQALPFQIQPAQALPHPRPGGKAHTDASLSECLRDHLKTELSSHTARDVEKQDLSG